MIPFKTTPEQVLTLASIVLEMQQAGISATFIRDAHELACTDQGVFDLMEIWSGLQDGDPERDEAIADIQDLIDDYRDTPAGPA